MILIRYYVKEMPVNLSIFDIIGPVMIGPSSSHTAGAARLGSVAAKIHSAPFTKVRFGLCGSFSKTGIGHGTQKALLGGVLGFAQDDERLPNSFSIADDIGIQYEFYDTSLPDVHENTVLIEFISDNTTKIIGSSIGGGSILITEINGMDIEISANSPTLIIEQDDEPGVAGIVTSLLAAKNINIGIMRISRNSRGGTAYCVIETDTPIPDDVKTALCENDSLHRVCILNL